MKSPYGSGVGLAHPPLVVGAAPFLLMVGLRTCVCGFSSRPVLQVGFLVVLAEAESLQLSLALSSVLPCPMLCLHVRLHDPSPGLGLSLAPYPRSYRMGFEPLSEAPLCALQPPAHSFLVVLTEAACLRRFLDLSFELPCL